MQFFSDILTLPVMDGTACALLGAAAAVRAKNLGAHFTGAIVLGCFCGLIGPLLRETFLHGAMGSSNIVRALPDDALVGALGGIFALLILQKFSARIFFWLDSASIGLACSLGAVLSLQELGIVGSLCLGLINGLAPGLLRDVSLGDTAMLVDRDWYATTAALGCVAALAMELWLAVGWSGEWAASNPDSASIIVGFLLVVAIMSWRGRTPQID